MTTMHKEFIDRARKAVDRLSPDEAKELLKKRRKHSVPVCRELAGAWSQSLDDRVGLILMKRAYKK